jgi:two-component system sensor histidine kinase CpxA
MRSLFLKIFLWFWLATAIVGAAYIFSISVTQSEPVVMRWREITANALSLYAHAAVEAFDREGASRVENYFEQLERETGIRAALFDEKGEKLCGENFAGAAEMAERAASTGEPEFRFSGPFTVTARSVKGLDGNRYVIVAEVPRTRFGIFRAEPEAWALRILAVLIASGIVCYWLARYLTSPVVRLRDATRQLASGDLSARVGPSARRDELANLGRDFDTMAERIESLIEAQRRLLGDISHELRSPLARLSVALGLARRQAGGQAAPSLDRIEREAERLNDLIGQLLSLSRFESGSERIDCQKIDLARLVREVAEDADYEARSRNRSVRILSVDECSVEGNHRLLASAIENVVRNAARHTTEGTQVEISLRCNDRARIVVRDHGEGVPESMLGNIFRPFYRVEDARDRQSGGSGLGLAITERAVRLHGGEVRAENAEGGGLLIEISFPQKQHG